MDVSLKNIIAPSFFDVHKFIKKNKYTHYWLSREDVLVQSQVLLV